MKFNIIAKNFEKNLAKILAILLFKSKSDVNFSDAKPIFSAKRVCAIMKIY